MRRSGAHVHMRHQIQRWYARSNGQAQRHATTPAHKALGIQASDKFFPFCWGKIFTFKNPDILKSCQIAKGSANSRVIGQSVAENCIGILGDYQVTSTIGKKMSSTVAKLLPLMGSGFWVSICFVKTWDGYFSPWLCSSLPPLEKSIHGWDFLRTGQVHLTTWHRFCLGPTLFLSLLASIRTPKRSLFILKLKRNGNFISSWWFQPRGKKSNWIISPGRGKNIKPWNHHVDLELGNLHQRRCSVRFDDSMRWFHETPWNVVTCRN